METCSDTKCHCHVKWFWELLEVIVDPDCCAAELLTRKIGVTLAAGWRTWEQWEWPWLGNRRPGYCFSSLYPAWHRRTLNSQACTMAFPGRARPSTIPENEEIPQTALDSVLEANGNEDERAVSNLQRRHSDVKVYKEFCDFYAKLWVSLLLKYRLSSL